MPARFWCQVPVAVMEPMERPVLPRNSVCFSRSMTLAPAWRAKIAAVRPEPPPPTTTTSVSS